MNAFFTAILPRRRTNPPTRISGRPLSWPITRRIGLCLALPALLTSTLVLTACATDSIESRRTGQLVVCHKQKKTLTVSNADSFVHLDHGDSPGPCPEEDGQD